MITGGTRGIGFALATQLLREGCDVMVCGSSATSVAEARDVRGLKVIRADLSKPEEIQQIVRAVHGELSGLDILINNAGIQLETDFLSGGDSGDIAREIAIDLLAPMQLTAQLLPLLLNAPHGVVVNISSALAMAPSARVPVYSGAKAGLSGWTAALRAQLASTSVRVVEVVPPLVKTDLTQGRQRGAVEPSVVSDAVVRGLQSRKTRIVIGKARILMAIARVSPTLAKKIVAK